MAAALQRDQDPANGWQLLQTYESQRVDDWIKWHSEPQFKTDLWFLVTDENGKETRVPACRTVLSINSVFIQNLPAGDEEIEVKIDRTICTDAITVVYFLWLNYPCFTKKVDASKGQIVEFIAHSPFDGLVDEVLDEDTDYDEGRMAELCLAIGKIASLADWIQCDATIKRLDIIMDKILDVNVPCGEPSKYSKYLYKAQFALNDVLYRNSNLARMNGTTPVSSFLNRNRHPPFVLEFPVAFLSMNDSERAQIADHVVPMFEAFLEGSTFRFTVTCGNTTARGLSLSTQRTLLEVNKFLLDFYKKARATIDAKDAAISTLKDRTLGSCVEEELVKRSHA